MNGVFTENSILLFFAQGAHFFLIAMLSIILLRQYKVRIKLILGMMLAFWVVLHIKDMIIFYGQNNVSQNQIDSIIMIDQLAVPMCTLFQLEVSRYKFINIKRASLFILPFVIFFVIYAIWPSSRIIDIMLITSATYLLYMIVSTIYVCCKNPKELLDKRSALLVLGALSIIGLTWGGSCAITSPKSDILYYLLSGIAWGVVYFTIENYYTKYNYNDEVRKTHDYPFEEKLTQLINDEQIFLNPELSMMDVARMIGTNRSYLSEYFNNNCHTSFIDYINNLRLDYAVKLMSQYNRMSLEEISITSGFNSISTFRRAFTKKYGVNPSNYRHEKYCCD